MALSFPSPSVSSRSRFSSSASIGDTSVSSALESYLEEVKLRLTEVPLNKPKNNLPPGERRALRELIQNKEIILKKADKGTTTVIMKRENKINEGQKQLDDRNNYQPLEKPMVKDTSQRVKHLINTLHNEGFIDEMTVKWFNQTPDPPRIPVFYTLTKIHKDLSFRGAMAPQNASHHL